MEFITQLWLPIVVSAAGVWVISALGWMVIGHHNKDMAVLADEKGFVAAVKSMGIKPGVYGYPNMQSCHKTMTPEQKKQMMSEPMGILRVWKQCGMATPMLGTLVLYLVIGVFIAYLGWAALPRGATFEKVWQVLGTAGILAYCFGGIGCDLWFQESRRAMVFKFIDGVVYGLATGAVFAWLWPK